MADRERILWKKMLNGDQEAFSIIYQKYSKILYLYGVKFSSNTVLIEDCIQDLFISIFNNSKIRTTDNIQFYLFRAFRNSLVRVLSREGKFHNCDTENIDFGVIFSIEETIIENETSDNVKIKLKMALDTLSKRQKEAIYLRFTRGLAYSDIAGIMDMEVESCRNTISRAIKKIRIEMKLVSSLCLIVSSLLLCF